MLKLLFSILLLVLALFANSAAFAVDLQPKGIHDLPDSPDLASDGVVAAARPNDFIVTFSSLAGHDTKFITFGWLGWSPKVIHWLYNDVNRPGGLVATPAAAVASIQNAMSKWTTACNIQFVYDGTTTTGPSLAGAVQRVARCEALPFKLAFDVEESFEDPFAVRLLPDTPRFAVQARYFNLGMSVRGTGIFSVCFS